MSDNLVDVVDFTEFYFQGLPADELNLRSPEVLEAVAAGHFRFAQGWHQGERRIRVFAAEAERDFWSSNGRIVIEVLADDRPFLVNSIAAYLNQNGFGISRLIHPVFEVKRDSIGTIINLNVHEPSSNSDREHARESWIHLELSDMFTQERQVAIHDGISAVIGDVMIVTEDFADMVARVNEIVKNLSETPPPIAPDDISQACDFASWLKDGHYTFLGYREYRIEEVDSTALMRALPETGLGILREGRLISHPSQNEAAAEAARENQHPLLLVTKSDARSTVQRAVHLDRISFRTFDSEGRVVGEQRFLGLLSSKAYAESIRRIPILDAKSDAVLNTLKYVPESYNGRAALSLLESLPRDELFHAEIADLARITNELLHASDQRQLRCFVRRDQLGRFLSILIYLPPDRFNTRAHEQINGVLRDLAEGGVSLEHTLLLAETGLARLHVVVRPIAMTTIDAVVESELQERLQEAIRTWDDEFAFELSKLDTDSANRESVLAMASSIPDAYREDFQAAVGVNDCVLLQSMPDDSISLAFRPSNTDEVRLTIYRRGESISLGALLPIFTSLGVSVVDERPYEVDGYSAWIYDFGLDGDLSERSRSSFIEAFHACWNGSIEVDGYNQLVVGADLPWRSIVILRTYGKYLRQAGNPYSDEFVQASLLTNAAVAKALVELFFTMFDPGLSMTLEDRRPEVARMQAVVLERIDQVSSRDADQVLRLLLAIMNATVRTNYFQKAPSGEFKSAVAIKLESRRIDFLPEPKPRFEIFCYSPRVEGVHLRFGLVARGGLRWSDRKEDFRTEVLGLVKAQMVKNAVIVPTGSKGGFYAKALPDSQDREAWLAEGTAAYITFVSALLDVTDNRVGNQIIGPPEVVRFDDDDPYLVVAADKGTAAFSDTANRVSAEYGFWLGDAFASGGSVGYDHKAMGITARGAWESVKRHFRDRGIDCQTEDFTCVGIGDMSGDVFGNAMMLSQHIQLVAAFDHRHIFVDPNPDPAISFEERTRLFHLPRSSWADYNPNLISAGGGVFDRSAKKITLTAEIKQALDIDAEVVSPPELISAILKAPVDLLFNGGIGTYVKASHETHMAVGDKSNDVLRVNGKDLRCAIVGEGGNLGFTQLGRIEYALNGGRINTDFIDNSAGVDTSDHEVNIKILLDEVIRRGELNPGERPELLASMTDEVAALVLAHNTSQNLALTTALNRAPFNVLAHWDLIRMYERDGFLNREIEYLPNDEEMARRAAENLGLSAPELAVLMAYTKIVVAEELKAHSAASDPFFGQTLQDYFPDRLADSYRSAIEAHPLRNEIIVTQIVNEIVDFAGITYFHRLEAETGADTSMLARAHLAATQMLNARALLHRLDHELVNLDAQLRTQVRMKIRAHVEQAARWLVNNTQGTSAVDVVAQLSSPVQNMLAALPTAMLGRVKAKYEAEVAQNIADGLPEDLAALAAMVGPSSAVLGLAQLTRSSSAKPGDVATMYFKLGERLGIDRLARQVDVLVDDGRWNGMARAALADDVRSTQVALTKSVISTTSESDFPEARVDAWVAEREEAIDGSLDILRRMWSEGELDLAKLTVSLQMAKRLLNG